MNFPLRLYLQCYASIHSLTKPKQRSRFIDLFSFTILASIVHTIDFAGFTGTNGSNCFHQVSYLKWFLSPLSRLVGKVWVRENWRPQCNKFTIKPSFRMIITIIMILILMLIKDIQFNLIQNEEQRSYLGSRP